MRKLLFAAAALAIAAPATSAFAADDRHHWRDHRSDHREHRQYHRDADRDHREAHWYGFDSRREHRAYHRDYRDDHGDFHEDHPGTRHDHRRRSSGRGYDGYTPGYGHRYAPDYGYAPRRW